MGFTELICYLLHSSESLQFWIFGCQICVNYSEMSTDFTIFFMVFDWICDMHSSTFSRPTEIYLSSYYSSLSFSSSYHVLPVLFVNERVYVNKSSESTDCFLVVCAWKLSLSLLSASELVCVVFVVCLCILLFLYCFLCLVFVNDIKEL